MASQSRRAVTPELFARSTVPPLFTAFSSNIASEVWFNFFPTPLLLFHPALQKVALRIIVQKGNVWQPTTVGIWCSKLLVLCWSLEGLPFVAGGKNVPSALVAEHLFKAAITNSDAWIRLGRELPLVPPANLFHPRQISDCLLGSIWIWIWFELGCVDWFGLNLALYFYCFLSARSFEFWMTLLSWSIVIVILFSSSELLPSTK